MLTGKIALRSQLFFSLLASAVLTFCFGLKTFGQVPETEPDHLLKKQIAQHVAAGEFPRAQELIDQLPAEQQDEPRAILFRQQIASGASRGAASTALSFKDENFRSTELTRVRSRFQVADTSAGQSFDDAASGVGPIAGARGGITENDFQPLMDLISNTISPSKWEDQAYSMRAFPSGVFVDHTATLQRLRVKPGKFSGLLTDKPATSSSLFNWFEDSGNRNANWKTELRMISLNRLERAAEIQYVMGLPFDTTMVNMAGLTEVKYVFVDREKGEIVIAGPAGPWHHDSIGRAINSESGKPVMQLEDFVVVLRNAFYDSGKFGCSIDPRVANLSAVQKFLQQPKKISPAWKNQLRETMGQQDIVVFGVDPRTHAASVLIEADYHMKLVGMGLEPSIPEVPSYLDRLTFDPNNPSQPSDVVRWWFASRESDIACDEQMEYFELTGSGVRVLSESELMGLKGRRIHTGKSTGPTQGFARDFSKHFAKMANRYPVYHELQNLFSLALVANLIKQQQLDQRCHRGLAFFKGSEQEEKVSLNSQESTASQTSFPIRLSAAPKQVASVMNERVFEHRQAGKTLRNTVFAVSGGVDFDAIKLLNADRLKQAEKAKFESIKEIGDLATPVWWWD